MATHGMFLKTFSCPNISPLNKKYFHLNENDYVKDEKKLLNHIKISIDKFNNKTIFEIVGKMFTR